MTPRRFALAAILVGGCVSHAPWGAASEGSPAAATRRVDIEVTAHGFQPKLVRARPRETITLVFERTIERSCADRVIISLDQERRIERDLPFEVPIEVTLVMERAGDLGFSCPMGMHAGTIEVRDVP